MDAKDFAKLHMACTRSLNRLCRESKRTLNLLSLVGQSPQDSNRREKLQWQIDEEDRARLDYQHRRRELFVLVTYSMGD
jgi:hypothetical protein